MVKPPNDKVERHYFEQFHKSYHLPDGCVTYGDKPDVIVHGGRKIGIEITNFYVQPGNLLQSEQRQRPLRENVLAEAHRRYLAGGGKPIELTFNFDRSNPIVPARMMKLSADLAEFARMNDNGPSGEINRSAFRDVMPEIASIYRNAREYVGPQWRIMQAHTVGLTCKDDLEAIVVAKESQAADYQECDAYWLLIVVDGINPAQEQEIRIDDPRVNSDVFERIVLYHTFGHVVTVK